MTGNAAMRRVNVAASRARQQMWIVYSVDPGKFPDGDLRGALISHCRDAGAATAPPADLLDACESQLERDVLQKIMARGYCKVSVQHSVGRYRIDVVVEGPHTRLAVECDGDRWHGPDVWHKDRARQQVLERAGWTFERIRGSAFYSDPEAALLPLWQRLAGLGIPTGDWWSAQPPEPVVRVVSGGTRNSDPVPAAGKAATPAVPAARPAEPGAWAGTRAGPALLPFQAWTPRLLPHPDTAPLPAVIGGLREIVAAEGPIHAQRAYRVYTLAAGGRRVGTEMRRAFHAATRQALSDGDLRQLDDETDSLDEKTLYAPGKPTVVVRELGPRQISDVPRSEVAKLIRYLGLEGAADDVVKRAVLGAYGLVRLTARTSQYLDECLRYKPRRSQAT
jgi:very-short-patch-repair endonuclease